MAKICHITSAHTSTDIRIFYKMCVCSAQSGYETFLVAPGESRIEKNVQIIGLGSPPSSRFKRFTYMAREAYKKALEVNADIYHLHDPELLPYALKLKKKNKHVIFDSHEDLVGQISEKSWIPKIFRGILTKFIDLYQAYVCKKLDSVISVTPHICKRFEDNGCKITQIANFPLIENMSFDSSNKIEHSIVFAGGIVDQWCHDIIIRAIHSIDDIKYILCGNVTDEYLSYLKSLPGWEKVTFKGQVPFKEVAEILSESTVGIAVLKYMQNVGGKLGSIGNTKIFEYMQAGLPLVCTNFKLWDEIISEYDCGLCVDPYSEEDIKKAIIYLFDNSQKAKEMGENGKRAVLEKYNWNIESKKLINLYRSILGANN